MLLAIMLGPLEIGVILVVVLLIFGPSKLPQLGSSVGKMLRGFKKEMKELKDDDAADAEEAASRAEIDVTPTDVKKEPVSGS